MCLDISPFLFDKLRFNHDYLKAPEVKSQYNFFNYLNWFEKMKEQMIIDYRVAISEV